MGTWSKPPQNKGVEERLDKLRTPHRIFIIGFWVSVATMIFAAIAAWPVIREWFQDSPTVGKAANSQRPQSQQAPLLPLTSKHLPPTNHAPSKLQNPNPEKDAADRASHP